MGNVIFNEIVTAAMKDHPVSKGSSTGDTAFEIVAKKFSLGPDNVERIYYKVRAKLQADGNLTKKEKR